MGQITETFRQISNSGRKAFIPYITACDPDLATTEALLAALAEAGADIIELGVPFSDPMADGPVIQRASERALKNSVGVVEILPMIRRFRQKHQVPVVLFTYFNPLLQAFPDNLGKKLKEAGVDGVLITDLIPEEASEFVAEMRQAEVDTIFLAAPTSTDKRLKQIAEITTGFIYVVARTGVTGLRDSLSQEIQSLVERVRRYTSLPVAVGFGVSKPEHVREVWQYADAAVVGSRLVLEIENHLDSPLLVEKVADLTRELIGTEARM